MSRYSGLTLDDIAPPLQRRSRTPSFSSLSISGHPSASASSSSSSSSLPPLPSLDARLGALSVPPPARPVLAGSISGSLASPHKGTACLPCKRGHLRCGKGRRPCESCIKKGRPEDCFEGADPAIAQTMMQLYYQRKEEEGKASSSKPLSKPVFDADDILYPISQDPFPSLGQSAEQLTYPPVGSIEIPFGMPGTRPVLLVMGKDLRIWRASNEALRTFGYHSHDMIHQTLDFYLPRDERAKWIKFSSQLFAYPLTNKGSLPMNAVELARVPMHELTAKVAKMITIFEDFHLRDHQRKYRPVTIELWYSSYFGACVDDVRTYDTAPIIAKVIPHEFMAHPTTLAPPTLPTLPSFTTSTSAFPSVLLPAPANIVPSLPPLQLPQQGRASPFKHSGDRLPPLTLPPLSASLGSSTSTVPTLPPLNLPPRKRRVSATLGDFPPLSGTDPFDHGSGIGSYTRPRLRSPSPMPGHRRSLSSETGQSSYSGFSSSSPGSSLPTLPPLGSSITGGLPSYLPPRPPSRNRRPTGNFQYQMGVGLTQGPAIQTENPYIGTSPTKMNARLPNWDIPHYKNRRSHIAIDDSN